MMENGAQEKKAERRKARRIRRKAKRGVVAPADHDSEATVLDADGVIDEVLQEINSGRFTGGHALAPVPVEAPAPPVLVEAPALAQVPVEALAPPVPVEAPAFEFEFDAIDLDFVMDNLGDTDDAEIDDALEEVFEQPAAQPKPAAAQGAPAQTVIQAGIMRVRTATNSVEVNFGALYNALKPNLHSEHTRVPFGRARMFVRR